MKFKIFKLSEININQDFKYFLTKESELSF